MPKNNDFITFGIGAEETVWFVPKGTLINEDPFQVPHTSAVSLGFISEDGIKDKPGNGDLEAINDMNGTPVVFKSGAYEPSVSLSLLQSGNDYDVDKVVYGASNVIGSPDDYKVLKNKNNKSEGVIVIDYIFENGARERNVYPNATIQLSDEITNNATDLRVLPVTISLAVDSEGNASTSYKKEIAG